MFGRGNLAPCHADHNGTVLVEDLDHLERDGVHDHNEDVGAERQKPGESAPVDGALVGRVTRSRQGSQCHGRDVGHHGFASSGRRRGRRILLHDNNRSINASSFFLKCLFFFFLVPFFVQSPVVVSLDDTFFLLLPLLLDLFHELFQ